MKITLASLEKRGNVTTRTILFVSICPAGRSDLAVFSGDSLPVNNFSITFENKY
jgi:hypothetical protein